MKQDITKELIKEATENFSEEFNFEKTIEEMGELLQAIQKYKSDSTLKNYFKVYGEVVDLTICVLMAKEYIEKYNNDNLPDSIDADRIMKEKLDRFISRIEDRKVINDEGRKSNIR